MTTKELLTLVAKMRAKQREYFRTRAGDVLSESKKLEHEVDKALREYEDGQQKLPM